MQESSEVRPYHALGRWCRGHVRSVELKPRDLDYLSALFIHGVLSTAAIQKLTVSDRTQRVVTDRFFLLKNPPNELVAQPDGQMRAKNANCTDLAFEVNEKGVAALVDAGRISYEDYQLWKKLQANYKPQHFDHDFATGLITSSIALEARAAGLRFISWLEILNRPKCPSQTRESDNPFAIPYQTSEGRRSLIPDALFGLEYPTGACFFALETDMGTEPIKESDLRNSAIGQKFKAYRTIIKEGTFRSRFALPSLTVLVVTQGAVRMLNMIEYLRKLADRDGKGSTSPVLFMSTSRFSRHASGEASALRGSPLAPWRRANHADVDLSRL